MRRAAASGCLVPASTPANSIWRKHVSSTTPIVGSVRGGSANRRSAAGLVAYDVTTVRGPFPPPNDSLYACSQPAVTSSPFARNFFQYPSKPLSPYFATVASRKARPGELVSGFSVTNVPLNAGVVRSSSDIGGALRANAAFA